MEFIVLRTSLAYGCMGLCCEMLNLVVLGKILWFRFRRWFSVMKIGRTTSERLGDVETVEHA